jgi:hypothetical protein
VPVALNLFKIREAKGPAGDFFRSVYKQKPQYQGLWVVAPEGRALASHQETKDLSNWPKKVLADLQTGLRAFGTVTERTVRIGSASLAASLPYRGRGLQPDGRVTLALAEKYVIVRNLDKDPPPDALGATVLDSITLSPAEWASFAPPQVKTGSEWSVPESVTRQLYPVLSVSSVLFRDSAEVGLARLTGKVESVEGGIAVLRYEGSLSGTHIGTADEGKAGNQCGAEAKTIGGVGTYNIKAKKMLSLTLVFDGLSRNWKPYDDPPTRFGAVVEWVAKSP